MKKLFLIPLIAMSFAQNVKADCLEIYETQYSAQTERYLPFGYTFGALSSAAGAAAILLAKDDVKFRESMRVVPKVGPTQIVSTAAGAAAIGLGALSILGGSHADINSTLRMIIILNEAQLGSGLELISIKREFNNSLKTFTTDAKKETVASIAARINRLNNSGALCESQYNLVDRDGLIDLLLFERKIEKVEK